MGDTTRLTDLTVRDLTERLASREPIPGGGSASALAGALGAALVAMVAELSIGRPESVEHEVAARELLTAGQQRCTELLELAEQDAAAYQAVVNARRLPKDSEADREIRTAALSFAMVEAARVPLQTATVAAEVLDLAERIASIGNRNAVSDAGVAAQLAVAAFRGALLNVQINLPYLPDDHPLRHSAPGEIARLEGLAAERADGAMAAVNARMVAA
ncbi:MAG: cyclodeaminase/cyclohydrolase family protein [Chloroflexota bacterium]